MCGLGCDIMSPTQSVFINHIVRDCGSAHISVVIREKMSPLLCVCVFTVLTCTCTVRLSKVFFRPVALFPIRD